MEILDLKPDEYAPYYSNYISHVPKGSLSQVLGADLEKLSALFEGMREVDNKSYAEGKWTVKELLVHCMDTERIFSTRALMIARGESSSIAGYDHEEYVRHSGANARSFESLREEWDALRKSTAALFNGFSSDDLTKMGTANNNRLSVRAVAYIIPGHNLHHIRILKEKYQLVF